MFKYLVTFEEYSEDGLVNINLGQDGYSELNHFDEQDREVYEVYSEYDSGYTIRPTRASC